jgi:hypothetical protein
MLSGARCVRDGVPQGRDPSFAEARFATAIPHRGHSPFRPLREQLCQAPNQLTLRIATSSPDLCIVLVNPGSDP